MMYDEFTRRLKDVPVPTLEEYTNIIEPVYNYHPALEVPQAKDKCAELYTSCGLGIFKAMRGVADQMAELEHKMNAARHAAEESRKVYDAAQQEYNKYHNVIMAEWSVKK